MMLDARPDIFKIDRFIVHGCARDERRMAIIMSVRELAARFDATLIAEGVETAEERDALLAVGIDRMQGYLFSPPVPAKDWVGGAGAPLLPRGGATEP
jgi:EAL domain-containing protein (putative c-di-GMP-specific phosphodiesterase class I)